MCNIMYILRDAKSKVKLIMSGFKVYVTNSIDKLGLTVRTSRAALYDLQSEESENEQPMPVMEFDFVEVDHDDEVLEQIDENAEGGEEEEYAFRLFGGPLETVLKVTLKDEDEIIINERPENYYRAIYSDREKLQFLETAITAEMIFQNNFSVDAWPRKIISIEEHNLRVAEEKKQTKKRRAGKKNREAKALSRERRLKREKIEKKIIQEKRLAYQKSYQPSRYSKPLKKREWGSKPKVGTD